MNQVTTNQQLILDIRDCIDQASTKGQLKHGINLSGFSGTKLLGALQRVACHQHAAGNGAYLEIGVLQGLSLVSVAVSNPDMQTYGIDNFAHHDPKGINQKTTEERISQNKLEHTTLINRDYEKALENLDNHTGAQKIGTYFIDGPHDYRSQFMCLELIKPYLADFAVIFVDDSNYQHVRQANRDFLTVNPDFSLLFEAYTECHPVNMTEAQKAEAKDGWWDGVNIIIKDEHRLLDQRMPPTLEDRIHYEIDHSTQALKHGYLAAEATGLVSALISLRPARAARELVKLSRKFRARKQNHVGEFTHTNTFSQQLQKESFNSSTDTLRRSVADL